MRAIPPIAGKKNVSCACHLPVAGTVATEFAWIGARETRMSNTGSKTTNRTLLSPGPHTPGQRSACVVVIYGEGLGQRISVDAEPTLIGRSDEADLQLAHPSVSRIHCRIDAKGQEYRIRDLGATNPTRVNDQVLGDEPMVLTDGDHITVGESVLKFIGNTSIEAPYHAEIYEQVTRDALTGLYNRRHFIELLDKELARASRYKRPLALCIIDIDLFKHINDTYGHAEGDQVLHRVAQTMHEHARAEDLTARIGGEEFAVLFPETALQDALDICERLREAVADLGFEMADKTESVTISVGVTELRHDDARTDFMQRADKAMYAAKHNGRNQTQTP